MITKKHLSDFLITSATSIITIFCLVLSTRFLALGFGEHDFGVLSVIRRIINTLEPLTTLGFAFSLTREIALTKNQQEKDFITYVAFILVFFVNIFFLMLTSIFLHIFLENDSNANISFFTSFLILLYSLYIIMYSYYRGQHQIFKANILQLTNIAIGPLIISYFFSRPNNLTLYLFLSSILFLISLFPFFKFFYLNLNWSNFLKISKRLLIHGYPRIISSFLFAILLSFGSFVTAYSGTVVISGYFAIGLAFLKVFEGFTESFGRVAYPVMTQIIDTHGLKVIKQDISDLIVFLIQFGLYATVHVSLWTSLIIDLWFGSKYMESLLIVTLINLCILPYLIYVTLRPVVEAMHFESKCNIFIFNALILMILCSIIMYSLNYLYFMPIFSTILGIYSLGWFILRYVFKEIKFNISNIHINKTLGILLFQICVILTYKKLSNFDQFFIGPIIDMLILEIGMIVLFIHIMKSSNIRWINVFIKIVKI